MSGQPTRRSARDARGSATLFAVSCLAVLLLLGSALGVVAAMVRAHRMAQSAADLAALAAASALGHGGEPCAAGTAAAAANRARLTACSVTGREVLVRVDVAGPRWLGQTADLSAEARAGPGRAAGGRAAEGWAAGGRAAEGWAAEG